MSMPPRTVLALWLCACLAGMCGQAAAFGVQTLPLAGRLRRVAGGVAGVRLCACSGPTTETEVTTEAGEEGSPAGAYVESEERAGRREMYRELFRIRDMAGDSRRFNAKQIAAGQKPLFVKRREKAALYDKLFSEGTTSSADLRVQAHAISTGKVTKLSQVKGAPEGSVRLGFRPLFD